MKRKGKFFQSVLCGLLLTGLLTACGGQAQESTETEAVMETQTEVAEETEASSETENSEDTDLEEWVEMSLESYAIFTEGDRTLRFVYTNRPPEPGDMIDGQSITQVYRYVESYAPIPDGTWTNFDHQGEVDTVIFEPSFASARPESTYGWFEGCQIKKVKGLENLNTSEAVDMSRMFYGCENLTELDLGGLETGNVADVSEMFAGCKNLTTINLCGWDKTNLTKLDGMFRGCEKLQYIDMSGLDAEDNIERTSRFYSTEGITTKEMFADCASLETILAKEDWNEYILDGEDMFRGCTMLSGDSEWSPERTGGNMARREEGYFTPYYLTDEYLGQELGDSFNLKTVDELLDRLGMDKGNPIYEFRRNVFYPIDDGDGNYYDTMRPIYFFIYQNEGIYLVMEDASPQFFLMPGSSVPEGILSDDATEWFYVHEITSGVIPSIDPNDLFSVTEQEMSTVDGVKNRRLEEDADGAFWVQEEKDGKKIVRRVKRKLDYSEYDTISEEFTLRADGTVSEKSVTFCSEPGVGYPLLATMYFDRQERPVFVRKYLTHGAGLEFWVYEKEKPSLYFYIDNGGGNFLGITAK